MPAHQEGVFFTSFSGSIHEIQPPNPSPKMQSILGEVRRGWLKERDGGLKTRPTEDPLT
jgi:hypothetical protein